MRGLLTGRLPWKGRNRLIFPQGSSLSVWVSWAGGRGAGSRNQRLRRGRGRHVPVCGPLSCLPPAPLCHVRGFGTSLARTRKGRLRGGWSNMKEERRKTVAVIYCHTRVHTGFTSATAPCSHPSRHKCGRAHTPLPLSGGRLPLPSAPLALGGVRSEWFGGGDSGAQLHWKGAGSSSGLGQL